MVVIFINGNLCHLNPTWIHVCIRGVRAPGPALLCDMHTESQCGGNRGHSFPKDRLAARAINYKRQGDRHRASLADRQTDSTAASADRPDRSRPRQIQRGEEERHVIYGQGGEKHNPPLVASRLRLSAPVLLSLLTLDSG